MKRAKQRKRRFPRFQYLDPLVYPELMRCSVCYGVGRKPGKCPICSGTGELKK